jgi:hypothetical protein
VTLCSSSRLVSHKSPHYAHHLPLATPAVVGSGMTSSSVMDAMGASDGRQILGGNFMKMFGIQVGTREVSVGRCSFRLGAPSNWGLHTPTNHSLAVDAVTVRITDVEDAFCVSLHRALGSSVRGPSCSEIDATALPSAEVRPTPHPRRSTRSSPHPHRARSGHEPGRTPPSSRSSDASVVPYAHFTDMWVHPVSLRQS